MSFPIKIPYGLKELKALISGDISTIIDNIKDWCNERFSLLGHSHSEYANKSHSHAMSDVTNLQSTLNGKAATNHTHSGYAPTSHTHTQSDVTGLTSALAGKASLNHTHTGYAAASSVGYIDWSQAVIIRSRNDADIYKTSWQSASAYNIKINGIVVCSISAATKNLPGYESVGTTSGHYTRSITILKRGLLMVADGSNGVGYCKRGTSSWTPIPIGASGNLGSICMNVFANDKVMVRSGGGLASDNDPNGIVYAPWVQG